MASTVTDQIDGVSSSTAIKAPVRCATTANITLSGFQTIDGITLASSDENLRVLVKNQTTTTENGIYKANANAWTREPDFDGNRDIKTGSLVKINSGTVNGSTVYEVTTADPVVIGTSNITFSKVGELGATTIAESITGSPETTTPVDANLFGIIVSGVLNYVSWANIKSVLATTLQFLQSGTGAVSRSVQSKLRETVSVTDFGAVGDGSTDDTDAIQAAIDTGKDVDFVGLTYACNNLTQSASRQRFYSSSGVARLVKNANGDLFTSSGDDVEFSLLNFRGDASTPTYTGHNVVCTGDNPRLINCGSRWAYARAVKATGGAVQIIGTCDIYQSALQDSASEYDIEIGVSGTATLYHKIIGINSTVSTGGIHTIDTGSLFIGSSQFGKLFIDAGTSPSGVNGGSYSQNRILGNITVEISSAIFTGNQISNVTITFAAGTGGHVLDATNTITSGATITNNGNANSVIVRSTSSGSYQEYTFGDSSSTSVMRAGSTGVFRFSGVELPNNKNFALRNAADDGDAGIVTASSSDNLSIANLISGKAVQISATGSSGAVQLVIDGAVQGTFDANSTAGNTRLLVYDVDNATLERVSVGAADSGGSGFKLLRIPN